MEIIELLGFFCALLAGAILGLLGGGGSILTVPILVYLFGFSPVLATAYSLFIVGTTSLIGSIQNLKKQSVDLKLILLFSIPTVAAVYITRRYLLLAIPQEIFTINSFTLSKDLFIMLLFAIVMLIASLFMIIDKNKSITASVGTKLNYPLIVIEGILVGLITGLVGAGGGFLIIPALVLLANLPMKKAVVVSLLIISIKSLIGFFGDIQNQLIDWKFLITFTFMCIIGVFIGIYLSKFLSSRVLKKAFGIFTFVMSIVILYFEIMK